MSKKDGFANALSNVMSGIIAFGDEQRRREQPYKDLFDSFSNNGYRGLLRTLERDMIKLILDAILVIEDKTGKNISRQTYELLLALPFIKEHLERDISKKDGISCCVDKTYFLLDRIIAQYEAENETI